MSIESWLESFKQFWLEKNIDGVISLFVDDVIYYESPFVKLNSKKEITDEWQGILTQNIRLLEFQLFCGNENKYAVNWKLSYLRDGQENDFEGIYFIKLNKDGLCEYFYQTCERKS